MSIIEPLSAKESSAPSRQSLLALSWLNFFLSGMQTAFGPIAAAYLAAQEWTAKDIGFALSIGGIASLISQVPRRRAPGCRPGETTAYRDLCGAHRLEYLDLPPLA